MAKTSVGTRARMPSDANQQTTFRGPLLFVNHDAKHMKAAPHRKRVFSHVQRRYRPWRRREQEAATVSVNDDRISAPASPSHPRHAAHPSIHDEASPTTIVGHGNSDPFDCFSVEIGPQQNELISFYRDVFLPAQYGPKLNIPNLAQIQRKDWDDCIAGMKDEGVAHGSLARWAFIIGAASPRLRRSAIEHQNTSTRLLRLKISRGTDLQMYDNYLHINMLYSAETISLNLAGALVHGKMLRMMFEEAWRRGTLDHKLLLWQVHNDVQTSCVFLVRPTFDVDHFLPMVLEPIWYATASAMPLLDVASCPILHPSIEGTLRELFTSIRTWWQTLELLGSITPQHSTPLLAARSMAEDFLHIGRFVKHYVSARDQAHSTVTRSRRVQLLVQASLALAGLYMAKSLNLNPIVLGRPTFDMRPAMLPALRGHLEELAYWSDAAEKQKYKDARLWALYVGALAESDTALWLRDGYQEWFVPAFRDELQRQSCESWAELKVALEAFLFHDRIHHDGKAWFERVRT